MTARPNTAAASKRHIDLPSHCVGSIEFVAANPASAAQHVIAFAKEESGRHVHLANAYTVALADKSDDYRELLAAPAVNFPDGRPIGWVSALRMHSPRLE